MLLVNPKKHKRAGTVTNFILIIGMLLIGVVVIVSLRKVTIYKAQDIETQVLNSIVLEISKIADKASIYPSDAVYELKIPYAEEYKARIRNEEITLEFTKRRKTLRAKLILPKIHVLDSEFSSSGTIYVYKRDNNLLITNDKLDVKQNKLTIQTIQKNITTKTKVVKCEEDGVCEEDCIIIKKCDPDCYSEERDGVCNKYCLDTNNDGVVDEKDSDGICDPDCYSNNYKDVYDWDCLASGDSICDPATNNIKDGICDLDCLITNGVCDPDCEYFDADCPTENNHRCDYKKGENCNRYPSECPCSKEEECRPECKGLTNNNGCVLKDNLKKNGEKCNRSCECESYNCIEGYCCNKGEHFVEEKGKCVNFLNDGVCDTNPPLFENCSISNDCDCSKQGLGECCVGCEGADEKGCCPRGEERCGNKCKEIKVKKKEKELQS